MLAAFGVIACPAALAAGPRQTASFQFSSTMPGAVTGIHVRLDFQNPDNPELKPYAVARMVVHGGLIGDTSVPPRCNASDAQVLAEGPAACPKGSKLGGGTAVADTGSDGGPTPRYTTSDVSDFNEAEGILGFSQNRENGIRAVDHTKFEGDTSTLDFPVFPGFPPPEPFTPVKSLDVTFPPYVNKKGRAYARTPITCPPEGYWTIVAEFTYHDGVTQTVESHSPCQPG